MARIYKNQARLEAISRKTTAANYRLSDQRVKLFHGRGEDFDELVYLRNQNTDAQAVNTRLSDAWTKFGTANGAAGARADHIKHDFGANGTYL